MMTLKIVFYSKCHPYAPLYVSSGYLRRKSLSIRLAVRHSQVLYDMLGNTNAYFQYLLHYIKCAQIFKAVISIAAGVIFNSSTLKLMRLVSLCPQTEFNFLFNMFNVHDYRLKST